MKNIMKTPKEKEFYKAEDLAKLLEVNIMTIYRYIKASKLKAYKIGREFRIGKEEFNAFLEKVKTI
jgi:excisionase family DNA binding protein